MLDSPCLSVADIVLLAANTNVGEMVMMLMLMSKANANRATVKLTVEDGNEQ
jgi:hypothetical protein